MKHLRSYFCFLLLWPLILPAQDIVPLAVTDIPQAMIDHSQTYDGESLWGYIDGGADIFLEYGFQSMVVQELTWNGEKLKLEIFRMQTPEGAFGIYSTSVIKCQQRDTLSSNDCVSRYQYQSAYGNLYVSITSESGSDGARQMFFPIAGIIMQKNPRASMKFPDIFIRNPLLNYRRNLVYMQGPLGLQNSLFPWQDLFLGIHFNMFAIIIPNQEADIYFARISFPEVAEMMRFLTAAGLVRQLLPIPNVTTPDGLYREYKQTGENTICFLERQQPYPIDAIINKIDQP